MSVQWLLALLFLMSSSLSLPLQGRNNCWKHWLYKREYVSLGSRKKNCARKVDFDGPSGNENNPGGFFHCCCCCCLVAHLCPTLCNPMDCSPPGSSVHGISQASILEWVAISSSKGSSQPSDWTHISCKSPALQSDSLSLSQSFISGLTEL